MKSKLALSFHRQKPTRSSKTQLQFTISIKYIQNLIYKVVKNDLEIERDKYLENTTYKRESNRNTYEKLSKLIETMCGILKCSLM